MEKPDIVIRHLDENDLNEWFRLRRKLWDVTADDDHRTEMLDILEHSDTQLILVAANGAETLCGFLVASIRPFVEDCQTDHVGYLEGWYVEPEYRERGIGRSLVDAAERWAKEKGCVEMASDAEIGNANSLQAHLKLGYDETSRLVHLRKDLV
jgi:aminoglycoside 6'-N-acetyltransferase I